jgi:hypothetical protein
VRHPPTWPGTARLHSLDDLARHRLLLLQVTGKEQTTPFIVQARGDGARNMQFLQLQGPLHLQ